MLAPQEQALGEPYPHEAHGGSKADFEYKNDVFWHIDFLSTSSYTRENCGHLPFKADLFQGFQQENLSYLYHIIFLA